MSAKAATIDCEQLNPSLKFATACAILSSLSFIVFNLLHIYVAKIKRKQETNEQMQQLFNESRDCMSHIFKLTLKQIRFFFVLLQKGSEPSLKAYCHVLSKNKKNEKENHIVVAGIVGVDGRMPRKLRRTMRQRGAGIYRKAMPAQNGHLHHHGQPHV